MALEQKQKDPNMSICNNDHLIFEREAKIIQMVLEKLYVHVLKVEIMDISNTGQKLAPSISETST